jgi:hypothetical protein
VLERHNLSPSRVGVAVVVGWSVSRENVLWRTMHACDDDEGNLNPIGGNGEQPGISLALIPVPCSRLRIFIFYIPNPTQSHHITKHPKPLVEGFLKLVG